MRSVFILALGIVLAYPVTVANAESRITLREECSRDRCVYYKGSQRKFSIENESGTSRLILRNSKREIVAKARRQDGGRIEVEKHRR